VFLPHGAGAEPFGELRPPVGLQHVAEGRRQGDPPSARPGLRLDQHEATRDPLRAVGRALAAAVPAASVPGGVPLQCPPDGEDACVEVDVLPGQSQRLALAEAECQGHRPASTARLEVGHRDQPGCVVVGQ
jgi:hypothetical protein